MMPDNIQVATIQQLLEFSESLESLQNKLRKIDWDSEVEGVELTRSHLASVLQRYIDLDLSEQEVEDWANLVEGREDVSLELGFEGQVERVLNELANPVLVGLLDRSRARILLHELALGAR